jgi:hypothetical protein
LFVFAAGFDHQVVFFGAAPGATAETLRLSSASIPQEFALLFQPMK